MSLIGEVIERRGNRNGSGRNIQRTPAHESLNGFPVVEHRSKSKSEFAKAKARQRQNEGILSKNGNMVPVVQPTAPSPSNFVDSPSIGSTPVLMDKDTGEWRGDMSRVNDDKIAAMSPEEREQKVTEVKEQLGAGIEDLMKRVREARKRREEREKQETLSREMKAVDFNDEGAPPLLETPIDKTRNDEPTTSITSNKKAEIPPKPAISEMTLSAHEKASDSPRSTHFRNDSNTSNHNERPKSVLKHYDRPDRPASTPPAHRRLRFTEPGPGDVHVYESAPSSPRRVLGLLAPAGDEAERESIPKFEYSKAARSRATKKAAEEGTPEYIRERYFPNEKPDDPALEWMRSPPPPSTGVPPEGSSSSAVEPRYDLSGRLIPESELATLPTHLGLHHHGDPSQRAGYTLSDLLHLSRSTVASQRSTMLTVLARIVSQESEQGERLSAEQLKSVVAVGVEAFSVRGSINVCTAGVQVIWSTLCSNTIPYSDLDSESEVPDPVLVDLIKTLPLDFLFSAIVENLEKRVLPSTAENQLLQILIKLGNSSASTSKQIIETHKLINIVFKRFLPLNPSEETVDSAVLALVLIRTLIKSSRENARELCPLCDSLLRYIATEPSSETEIVLLEHTLYIYANLARYGLRADLATTAAELFRKLEHHLTSSLYTEEKTSSSISQQRLAAAHFTLVECWIVCATDPHATTPSHDILWNQVIAWNWGDTLLDFVVSSSQSKSTAQQLSRTWESACHALSAWLEGCSINSPKRGDEERRKVRLGLVRVFQDTSWAQRIRQDMDSLSTTSSRGEGLARICGILRLYMACSCSSPATAGDSDGTDPVLPLPVEKDSLDQAVDNLLSNSDNKLLDDSSAQLCAFKLRLDLSSSTLDKKTWFRTACLLLTSLSRRSQYIAEWLLSQIPTFLTPDIVSQLLPEIQSTTTTDIWNENPFGIILPFLLGTLRTFNPQLSPSHPTINSIKLSTTQSASEAKIDEPILPKQWPTIAINHLLRSGTSPVFKTLPESWNASETEVVRSSLLLCLLVEAAVPRDLGLTREEVIFECMKVFMLEHDQPTSMSTSDTEVFRDEVVERLMGLLLHPFIYGTLCEDSMPSSSSRVSRRGTLEEVSKSFLGSGTPFYQFYTDFIGLYDSISFSHPLFSSLLLPILSSEYPADYRTLLLADYARILRNIKTPLTDLLAGPGDLMPFFYPVNTEPKLLGSLVDTLTSGQLDRNAFLYFYAVHHLACNIWPDLRRRTSYDSDSSSSQASEEKAVQLLDAITRKSRAPFVLVDLLRYYQPETKILVPPDCFQSDKALTASRKEWVVNKGKADIWECLEDALTAYCLNSDF